MDWHADDRDRDCVAPRILMARRSARHQGEVEIARVRHEVPHRGAGQRLRVVREGKTPGRIDGADACVERIERAREPREVVVVDEAMTLHDACDALVVVAGRQTNLELQPARFDERLQPLDARVARASSWASDTAVLH